MFVRTDGSFLAYSINTTGLTEILFSKNSKENGGFSKHNM
jgi:hypothetical protein